MTVAAMDDRPRRTPPLPVAGTRWRYDERSTLILRAEMADHPTVWHGCGLTVISTAIDAEYRGQSCRQNHLSVAVKGHSRRASDAEMDRVRADFDMLDAEEDNHSPGVARHLFLPLHLPKGTVGACDCKDGEEQMIEADGYRWSKVARGG